MKMRVKIALWCIMFIFASSICSLAGPLTDTGLAKCYDDWGNELKLESWPQPGQKYYGQDANYKINPQSYTKLGYDGAEMSAEAAIEDGWIMVRDNVTGLIWEVKTDDETIHDKDNRYTWYDNNQTEL